MLTIFGSHGLNSHADICTCVSLETFCIKIYIFWARAHLRLSLAARFYFSVAFGLLFVDLLIFFCFVLFQSLIFFFSSYFNRIAVHYVHISRLSSSLLLCVVCVDVLCFVVVVVVVCRWLCFFISWSVGRYSIRTVSHTITLIFIWLRVVSLDISAHVFAMNWTW